MANYESLPQEAKLIGEPYYFGRVERSVAEQLLGQQFCGEGTFLVRGGGDGYRLSLLATDRKVFHYKVSFLQRNQTFSVERGVSFPSISALVRYYSTWNNLADQVLTEPCSKSAEDEIVLPEGLRLEKMKNIELLSLIHEGSYAQIWKARLSGKETALKLMSSEDKQGNSPLQEATRLHFLRHKHVVDVMGVVNFRPASFLLEYCCHLDALDYLLKIGSYEAPFYDRLKIVLQVTSALRYIAEKGYVHRNVRANNVLLNKEMCCKLTGFFHARKMNADGVYFTKPEDPTFPPSAVRWMSIEVTKEQRYSTGSDIWALAALMYELFTNGEAPFETEISTNIAHKVEIGHRPIKPEHVPDAVYSIMLQSWHPEVKSRPSFSVIEKSLGEFQPNQTDENSEDDTYEDFNADENEDERSKKKFIKKKNKVQRYISMRKIFT